MQKFIIEHEKYIRDLIDSGENQNWDKLREYHKVQIEFMQHERLVHMIVTLFFGMFLAISLALALILHLLFMVAIVVVIAIVEIFYMLHLYKLETGVQRWYGIYKELTIRADKQVKDNATN